MDYFQFATDLARMQAADVRYEIAHRKMLESFAKMRKARTEHPDGFYDDKTQAEVEAEELYCFDRAESQAINATR